MDCSRYLASENLYISVTRTTPLMSLISLQVLDPSVLPDYPYRDDGLLLYEAIYRYVSSVIEARYGRWLF